MALELGLLTLSFDLDKGKPAIFADGLIGSLSDAYQN